MRLRRLLGELFFFVFRIPPAGLRTETYRIAGLKEMIEMIAKGEKNLEGVEIGTYIGESTVILAKHCKHITTVDPWLGMPHVEREARRRLQRYANIEIKKTTSRAYAQEVPNASLDFVYIDGLHTYDAVREDIALWTPKVKPGGFICGHDYDEVHSEVMQAVNEAFSKPDSTFIDASWIKQCT